MAALRSCFCALVALQSAAAACVEAGCEARDNVLLVQKHLSARQGDLHLDNTAVLASLSPAEEAQLLKVHEAIRQLPFELPANVSMEDLLTMGQKILGTFRNESFVAAIHENLGVLTDDWAVFLSGMQAAGAKLDANCTTQEAGLTVIEAYWRTVEAGMTAFIGKVVTGAMEMAQKQPNETKTIIDAVQPLLGSMGSNSSIDTLGPAAMQGRMTEMMPSSVMNVITKFAADNLFANKSQVCSKFQANWVNISALGYGCEKASSFVDDMTKQLPQFEGLIVALAPDVGDRVMGVINASMKAALNMTSAAVPVAKAAVAALKVELEECASCKMPVPEEAGSMRTGPSLLVSLALAVAAWFALRQ